MRGGIACTVVRPRMATEKRPALWLESLFTQTGKSKGELALRLNLPQSAISKLLKGDRQFKVRELGPTADFFGITRDRLNELMGGDPDQLPSLPIEYRPPPAYMPVYGVLEMDAATFEQTSVAKQLIRPQELDAVKDAFAVYVGTDNMHPALERGDIAAIDPSKPVAPTDVCLFINADGKRRTLRKLVAITEASWRVEQYNPSGVANLSRKDWPRAFRVFSIRKRGG